MQSTRQTRKTPGETPPEQVRCCMRILQDGSAMPFCPEGFWIAQAGGVPGDGRWRCGNGT